MVFSDRPDVESDSISRHLERCLSRDVQKVKNRFLDDEAEAVPDGGEMLGDGKSSLPVNDNTE